MNISKEQAHYLMTNEAFQLLVEGERMSALEALARCEASDTIAILRQQQRVAVAENLRFEVERLAQTVDEAP